MITAEQGFTVAEVKPLVPLVEVGGEVRDRMMCSLAAMLLGDSPQEIATQLRSRWRPGVQEFVARSLEADELSGHVDVLLVVLQSPAAG